MYKPIEVLYEDDCYVVFEKPAGILVIPSPKNEKNTLVNIVNAQYSQIAKEGRLHPCHRLDRDTSGAIIFAKGKRNQQLMMEVFHRRSVRKKYIAFVHGQLPHPMGEIKGEIKDFNQKRFARGSRGKLAITRYRVIDRKKEFTVAEVSPLTGRTNQIRIHFSEIGHPLLGERKYAFGRDHDLKFKRTALHASQLEWTHPVTHKPVKINSPLPKDMEEFLRRIRT